MNEPLFKSHLEELFAILDNSDLDKKEIELRKNSLKQSTDLIRLNETQSSYNSYHQIAHEIESLHFLSQFGALKTSQNYKNDEGCDFVLNNNIYIECVCSSGGDIIKNGLHEFLGEGVFDYSKKKDILNVRFTSSLNEKIHFYNNRVGKSIPRDKPYIIFLGIGSLAYEWIAEDYGMALLDILIGRGFPIITVNTTTNEVVQSGYTHNASIKKHNGASINCNLFLQEDYKYVSAVILSTATLDYRYDRLNTFIYINPNASNGILAKDFKGLVYWKRDKKGYYTPRRNGKVLSKH